MANESRIKNTKKYDNDQIIQLIKKEFYEKFKLTTSIKIVKSVNSHYVSLKIKDLIIPIILEKENIFLYDTPQTSFSKANNPNTPYGINFSKYTGMSEYLSAYAYLQQYLTNFLAQHMNTKIESDGAGELDPFSPSNKYNSYKDWFTYWKIYYENQPFLVRLFMTNPSKIKTKEISYFPELSFDN